MSAFFSSLFLEPVARRFSFPAWAGHQGDGYPAPQERRPRISTLAQASYHLPDDSQNPEALSLCLNEARCPRTLTRHTRIPTFVAKTRISRASSCPNGPPYALDEASKLSQGLTPAGNETLDPTLKDSGLRRAFASEANLGYRVEPAKRRNSRKKRRRHPHVQPMQAASDVHVTGEQLGPQDERRIDGFYPSQPAAATYLGPRQNTDRHLRRRDVVSDGSGAGNPVFNARLAATRGRTSPIPTPAFSGVAGTQQDHATESAISDPRLENDLTVPQVPDIWGFANSRVAALNTFSYSSDVTHETEESTTLDASLPANDGMRNLRRKMHEIRELAISTEEKAKRMHALMMADYNGFKGFQHAEQVHMPESLRKSSLNPASAQDYHDQPASRPFKLVDSDLDSLQMVEPADLEPSYYPSSPGIESEDSESTSSSAKDETDPAAQLLGCAHYKRNVKIQCVDCQHWYPCRHCHDDVEDHALVRKKVRNMLCMKCNCPQRAAEYCTQCHEQAAIYYCEICKLWDNDSAKKIYHCEDYAPGQDQGIASTESTSRAGRELMHVDTSDTSGTSTLESQIPPAPLPTAANTSVTDSSLPVPHSDSTRTSASESHALPAVSALDVSAETASRETHPRAPILSPIPRAADPQLERPRSSVNAESRPLTASNTDDEEDDANFWGESISPSRLVPSGWGSPTLFASSSNGEETERASSLGSGNSGWPFDPRQWRIGSPFFGSRSAKSDDGDTLIERKQERDEDFEFYEEEEENRPFAWPINPSAWRLSSPGFFASSTKAEQPTESGQSIEAPGHIANGPVPSSWPINPSSLLEGFSGPRLMATSSATKSPLSTSEPVHSEVVENPSQSAFASWGLNVPTPGLLLARRLSGWAEAVQEQDEEDESSSEDEANNGLEDDNGPEEDEEEELDLVGHR
ncbi:MAG: hypothetical protein M1831_004172 [Alyxoria varia]|nr:MAG: hypothetical protein M1831_004172 [Alyxoria varia]